MTMIKAHAAENGQALPNVDPTNRRDVLPNIACSSSRRTDAVGARSWRASQLNMSIVGLILVASSVLYASEASKEQPQGIPGDQAARERSVASGGTGANVGWIEKPMQAAESDRPPTITVQKQGTDGGEIGSERTSESDSNPQAAVVSVAGKADDKILSDTEFQADGAAGEQNLSGIVRTDPVATPAKASAEEPSKASAEDPPRPDAPSPPALAAKTRSASGRSSDPAPNQIGRIITGVNMRAGPSNAQPVLATIPRGSSVEVVKCQRWCEVSFAGQRGWVYKTFIRAPLADVAKMPMRTKSKPRKVGRLKPARARLSAAQSTRDARDQSGSSYSGPTFLGAIEYLWQQISPSALWPKSN